MRQVWLLLPFVNMSLAWSEDGPPGQTRSEWTGLEPLVAMESGKPRPNGTRRIVVSWGSTGPWRSTDLQSIEQEKRNMKRFFSHEVIKQATELIMQRSIHMEGVKADMAIAIAERKWNQDSQIPSMGVAQGVNVRREAVTPDVRSEVGGDIWNAYVTNWKVFVYDDRDPIQRRWLLRMADTLQSHETPIVLAAGFSSRKNLFMFQSAFPGLGITAAHPDLITESGVKQLPAMIQFTNAYEQVYTEGYHLAEIEAWESERNERIENAALVSLPQTTTTRIPEAPASTFDPQKPLTEPAPDR